MVTKYTDLRAFTDKATHVLLQGTTDAGAVTTVNVDDYTRCLVVISQEHHNIHVGKTYRYEDSITLASAASQDYLISVGAKYPHMTFRADGSAITQVQVFEATDRAGTTLQATFNANRNSTNTAVTTIYKGASGGTTDGTRIATYKSGSASNQSQSAASDGFDRETILKLNTKYIIRITSSTNDNLCNLSLNWYE